jgi:membrane protease YdiL (CAAX protease family)
MDYSKDDGINFLQQNPIFSSFDRASLNSILAESKVRELEINEVFIKEGACVTEDLFLVLSGTIEVFHERKTGLYPLNQLPAGSIIGEAAIIGAKERSASMRAKTHCTVLAIPAVAIKRQLTNISEQTAFWEKLNGQLLENLKKENHKSVALLEKQKNAGFFIINIIVFLSLFALFLPYLREWRLSVMPTLITLPIILFATILLFIRLYRTKTPLSAIGIKKENLGQSIRVAVWYSLIAIAVAPIIKWILIQTPWFAGKPLFNPEYLRMERYGIQLSFWGSFGLQALYAFHAVLQEILARGALQGSLIQFLPFNRGNILSIVLASFVFSTLHAYHGMAAVLGVFFPGLFWGWLYNKQGNLAGAIVSHVITGVVILNWMDGF